MKSLTEQTRGVRLGNRRRIGDLACGVILAVVLWAPAAGAQVLPEQIDPPGAEVAAEAPKGEPVRLTDPRLAAPAPQCPATIAGFAPLLPTLPVKPARTTAELSAFVENLGTTDATIEVVVGEGRLLTLKENLAVADKTRPLVAVGDPTVVDSVIVGPRQMRLVGQRIGSTDLSITTSIGQVYTFRVHVVADLDVLRCQLKAVFPDASLKLAMIKDHVVVEGEARDTAQMTRIIQTIRAYLVSVQATQTRKISGQSSVPAGAGRPGAAVPVPVAPPPSAATPEAPVGPVGGPLPPGANVLPEPGQLSVTGTVVEPSIINLIRVIGSQQVLLKVRVAELNRTAMREIGADILGVDPDTGAIVGTQIGGAGVFATGTLNGQGLTGQAVGTAGPSTTVFGIFQKGDFEVFLRALRRNLLLKTLAEPNLVTMNGHTASFLAGGEYPVPVPQVGASGVAPTITVQFKEFGVRLGFTPFILDGDMIRLSVDPEVSAINFAIGTTLVAGGSPVPGLDTRKAHTTVELHQGQTLMIAGLIQLSLDGQTSRIPGLGDLPILGPFFSNTTSSRMEKELVVMVTPYLVEPLNPDQVPPTPGDEVREARDLELYFLGRFEGRTGRDFRSTVHYDDPFHLIHHVNLEKKYLAGPCGYSD
jgi:pilus assembly protein CpaC